MVTAILSTIFLKERLSFIGKIGCAECIFGATVIVINAPKQAQVSTIQDMQDFVIAPGFLSFAGTVILACVLIVVFAAPRWGNQSMLVYLSVCSLIGGLSVACIQGIGAAIIAQANGIPQFNQWFTYVLIVFVITTLLVEIVYLNVSYEDPLVRCVCMSNVHTESSKYLQCEYRAMDLPQAILTRSRLQLSHPHITSFSPPQPLSRPRSCFVDSKVAQLL